MVDESESGSWHGVHEAAALLGVSVSTLRRRLKLATVIARREQGRYGAEWQVWVADDQRAVSPVTSEHSHGERGERSQTTADHSPDHGYEQRQVDSTQAATTLELVRLVSRLQEENRNLAGQLGYVQAQLQQRDDQLRALTAGTDPEGHERITPHESAQDEQETASAGRVVADDLKRPSAATQTSGEEQLVARAKRAVFNAEQPGYEPPLFTPAAPRRPWWRIW